MASTPSFALRGDPSASARYAREDLIDPPFRLTSNGTLQAPTGPGLGVRPVPERLAAVTRQVIEMRA